MKWPGSPRRPTFAPAPAGPSTTLTAADRRPACSEGADAVRLARAVGGVLMLISAAAALAVVGAAVLLLTLLRPL